MDNLFSDALKGLGDFGNKLGQDAQRLVEDAVKRGEAMQSKPQRTWEQKKDGYAGMGSTPLSLGVNETASPASSVSQAPSVSSTSSVSSVQSEGGDSARSNASKSSYSSLMKVMYTLMGRSNDGAPLNQAPSSFDSKNPEKNNNKESSKSFSAMFTSLCNSAISFFKNLSKEESAKQEKTSSPPESIKRVEKNPQLQQPSSGYGIGGLWEKLKPGGVFVEVRDPNTNLMERFEFRPRDLLPTPINPSAISFNPPTTKEVKNSAVKALASIKAKAVYAGGALAGACGVASEGFNTKNARDNLGVLASVAGYFASSSPSGSPSASMAQSLKSGAKWLSSSNPDAESMRKTTTNAAKALARIFASSGSPASYGRRYDNPPSFSAGFLGR